MLIPGAQLYPYHRDANETDVMSKQSFPVILICPPVVKGGHGTMASKAHALDTNKMVHAIINPCLRHFHLRSPSSPCG